MSSKVLVELDLPADWRRFRMPSVLEKRLQALLDKQDDTGKLTVGERREAEALVELSEMLSYLKLRSRPVRGKGRL